MPIRYPDFTFTIICDECGKEGWFKPGEIVSKWWCTVEGMKQMAMSEAEGHRWQFDEHDCYCPECARKKGERPSRRDYGVDVMYETLMQMMKEQGDDMDLTEYLRFKFPKKLGTLDQSFW